jgi:hypothetical protein
MFKPFADKVRKRFEEMCATEALFEVAITRDEIWNAYLAAFPEGSNLIYRQRSEHDCSICRHFIYNVGNVVAIQNGALSTVWDLNALDEPYQTVADKMSQVVKSHDIRDVFLSKFAAYGQAMSRAYIDNQAVQFSHFSVTVPRNFITADVASRQSDARTTCAVLKRGLTELKPDAISTVLDLIRENNLYRGAEYSRQLEEFQKLQTAYFVLTDSKVRGNAEVFQAVDPKEAELFIWSKIGEGPSVTRLRNTAIGTLLQDLSADRDLEESVKAYERVVAPTNYKRPTALISKAQIEQAMKTIRDLGLETALERRHARFSDVSVNSVLFVDNAVRSKLKDETSALQDLLMQEAKATTFDPKHAQEISVDAFMSSILPKSKSLQLYLENEHLPNFVSLTAPVHADASPLFKWNNGFGWSYDGNVTDSIKDKVKKAGGRVEGVALRVSLAWYNYDDLDLHCLEPGGNHIYYGRKENSLGQQILDVDMNAGGGFNRAGHTREPVENLRWIDKPRDGVYKIFVNNYAKTENCDFGFEIEIEGNGLKQVQSLRYTNAVSDKQNIDVAEIVVKNGEVVEIKVAKHMVGGAMSREQWGLKTLTPVPVDSIILSPNYWDMEYGNKHWFFILRGCHNPNPTRGIYNEFLRSDLEKHRKVFEILGEKTKCPAVQEQLSGVGFSSTQRARVTVMADKRPYAICF